MLGISESKKCISVCGSGGKSSLCYSLAKEAIASGKRSAITTTTHIALNNASDCTSFLSEDAKELEQIINSGKIPVAGKKEGDKLVYGGNNQLKLLLSQADTLYVEADGSKMLPLKYPNNTEPVIPEETDLILVICGLSAYGKPINEVCHRYLLAQGQIPGVGPLADSVTIANILWKGYGKYDPVFVLNQADTAKERCAAKEIAALLYGWGAKSTRIISLKMLGLVSERPF